MDEGEHSGTKFISANEAVNTIREPSSNAFLFTHFFVAGRWIVADELRRIDDLRCDKVEEEAIMLAIGVIRSKPEGKLINEREMLRRAADLVKKHPAMIDEAARQLTSIKEAAALIDLSALGPRR